MNKKYEKVKTKENEFSLIDKKGSLRKVSAVVLNQLTESNGPTYLSSVHKIFPEVNLKDVERPEGPVDVLLGQESISLHPVPEIPKENFICLTHNLVLEL